MIVVDCEQGSPEWIKARLGIPTASQFSRIITPKTMKLSGSVDSYLCELLAEQMLGTQVNDENNDFMMRGTGLELDAVSFYELQRDTEAQRVGFCLADDRRYGCSPDRLVGEDGGLEIKCPSAPTHVSYMLDVTEKYRPQVQGALWITGRKWWDFLSYNPELPPVLVRFERDEEFITALSKCMAQFLSYMDESREKLVRTGYMKAVRLAA